MATKTKSASEQLAALDQRVGDATRRRDEIDAGRRTADRGLRGAEGARLELEERRGAGEDVSEEEVSAALTAIEQARGDADERVWNARREGAERAITEATSDRQRFVHDHFPELAAEIAAEDGPARDALVDAWNVLQDAAAAYARQTRRWHTLARYGVITAEAIPSGTPIRGDVDDVARLFEAGIPAPTPPALAEG
jgi:hypothetical protein